MSCNFRSEVGLFHLNALAYLVAHKLHNFSIGLLHQCTHLGIAVFNKGLIQQADLRQEFLDAAFDHFHHNFLGLAAILRLGHVYLAFFVENVRVNIVAPALTVSDMGEKLSRAITGEDDIHHLDAKMPFGRVALPADVAAAVVWFVSDANSYCSGQKLNIDGAGQATFR